MRIVLATLLIGLTGCGDESSPHPTAVVPPLPGRSRAKTEQGPEENSTAGSPSEEVTLADSLRNRRVVLNWRGRESWVELKADGTTLDQTGLIGRFTIEGLVLTTNDDDGIGTVEFNTPTPGPGDVVWLSLKKNPDAPVFGPVDCTVVKITAAVGGTPEKNSVSTGTGGDVVNPETPVLTAHPHRGKITSISWHPDGTRIASASSPSLDLQSGTLLPSDVKIWDVSSGKTIESFSTGQSQLPDIAWSPDGKRLAVSFAGRLKSLDGDVEGTRVVIRDIPGGKEICSIRTKDTLEIGFLDWSPDGKQLAGISGGTARVWMANTGKLVAEMTDGNGVCLDWNPKDNLIAVGTSASAVRIWDPIGKQPTRKLQIPLGRFDVILSSSKVVRSLAWSPDGKRLVASNVKPVVWDVGTGKEMFRLAERETQHSHPVKLTWSADGKRIAGLVGPSTQHNHISVWDASTGKEVFMVRGHSREISDLAWSPDSKTFAASGRTSRRWVGKNKNSSEHSVKFWKLPDDSLITVQDIKTGDLATLTRKIQNGANVNHQAGSNPTPLHHAIDAGNKSMFRLLLKHDANVKLTANVKLPRTTLATTGVGTTPLHLACMKGQREFIKPLLEKGADINAKNRFGQTPLDIASTPEIAKWLRDNGARWGTLRGAVRGGDLATVKKFLEGGASPNRWRTSGFPGDPPLLTSVKHGNLELARLLVKHGAKVDRGPLHRAVSDGHLGLVTLLVDNDADVNSKAGIFSEPPLHLIAGNITVRFTRRKNGSGKIMGSELKNRKAIAELLIKRGAKINALAGPPGDENTVLDKVKRHKELADLLRKHGAMPRASIPATSPGSSKGAKKPLPKQKSLPKNRKAMAFAPDGKPQRKEKSRRREETGQQHSGARSPGVEPD